MRFWVFGAAMFFLGSVPASAQEATPVEASAEVGDTRARHLFEAGSAAFREGRYREALERFQSAYELSGRSSLLYNVGQAADRLRQDDVALEAFELFLATNPEHPRIQQVRARVEVLRAEVDAAAALQAERAEVQAESVVPPPAEVAARSVVPVAPEAPEAEEQSSHLGLIVGVSAGVVVVAAVAVVLAVTLGGGTEDFVEGNFVGRHATLELGR